MASNQSLKTSNTVGALNLNANSNLTNMTLIAKVFQHLIISNRFNSQTINSNQFSLIMTQKNRMN
jgi:hypothetical protein